MTVFLRKLWCELFHPGGSIIRDERGCINWECSKCGRRGEPVPIADELLQTERDITEYRKRFEPTTHDPRVQKGRR